MNLILGLTLFVVVVGGFAALRKLRGHIAQLTSVIDRQEADLLTCVEAQRHTALVLHTYGTALGQLVSKLTPESAGLLHALTSRLATQGAGLAQALSHWDGRSDPRGQMYPAELDADIEELVLAADDIVLRRLWACRRPEDVAQMVRHILSVGLGLQSDVEAELQRTEALYNEPTTQDIVAAWQRPTTTQEHGRG